MQADLIPPLVRAHPHRRPSVWSVGSRADGVAIALAFAHSCQAKPIGLRVYASTGEAGAERVSFGSGDVCRVPQELRTQWLRQRGHRWRAATAITDNLVDARPPEPVDLVTVRGREVETTGLGDWADRVRTGGRMLLIDPPSGCRPASPGLRLLLDRGPDWRLYRKVGHRARTSDREPARGLEVIDVRARVDRLVRDHLALAYSLARRFDHRGEPIEDLRQVAALALIKSARRYDPSRGVAFSSFAMTSITGELKRHFRDKTWALKVPRVLQERYLAVKSARDELTAQVGSTPTVAEIADHLGLGTDDVLEAMEAGDNFWPRSLDASVGEDGAGAEVPVEEGGFEQALERSVVERLVPRLDDRERLVLQRIFFDGRNQRSVAAEIGVSQMQVSRILAATLRTLRRWARVPAGDGPSHPIEPSLSTARRA